MKKAAPWLALVLAVVLMAPPLSAAAATEADRQREIQDELSRLREELDEVAAQEADVLAELRVTQRRKAVEDARLADIDGQMAAAQAEVDAAQAMLDRAIAKELRARRRLESARAELDAARDRFREQVVSAYMHDARLDEPQFVRDPDELEEMATARALVSALNEQQADLIDRLEALEQDTRKLERDAESARSGAARERNQVEQRKDELAAARSQQAAAAASVSQEASREQQLLGSLRGTRAQYERRIREQQAESDRISELLRRRGNGGPKISGKGSLSSPVADPVITSTYGYRTHPIFGDRRLHTGLDFRAPNGTPLLAARAGEVIYAGWRNGYGNTTIVDHGGGLATLYAHQSAFGVEAGDEVARGQRIGSAGATGYATGPHLHFEVRQNGTPVDPLPYL